MLVALVAGGAVLLVLLQGQLIDDATTQTVTMARDVAARYTNVAFRPHHVR